MGVTAVLSIARRALLTQQMAIEVASHNIANVNTPGYSRQQLLTEPTTPMPVDVGQIGTGVKAEQIIQFYDQFMNLKVNQKTSSLAGFDAKQSSMKVIETLFNETTQENMSKLLDQFWGAWNDLANNPTGSAERSTLVEHTNLLTDQFHSMYTDIGRLESDMDLRLKSGVDDINSITARIADLNAQIVCTGNGGKAANDLRDSRENLIRQLSDLLNVAYFESSDGAVTIMTDKGSSLVMANEHWDLELSGGHVNWISGSGAEMRLSSSEITEGKLGGWLAVKEEIVPGIQTKVDALASSLIREVNSQHSQGIGLTSFTSITGSYASSDSTKAISASASGLDYYDTVTPGSFELWLYDADENVVNSTPIAVGAATTLNDIAGAIDDIDGLDASVNAQGKLVIGLNTTEEPNAAGFGFSDDNSHTLATLGINTFFNGNCSGSIELNSNISGNRNFIAAGKIVSTSGAYSHGDNENALALASLQHDAVDINGESVTFGNFYNALVGDIGIRSSGYARDYEFTKNMVNQLSQERDAVSGVSLDEEMATLVKFQHAYGAAAKLIQISDEMLQELIQLK